MIHNLIPVLNYKYGEDVKNQFFPEALESAKDDYWDEELKKIMCKTDKNISEAEEYDAIGLNIAL